MMVVKRKLKLLSVLALFAGITLVAVLVSILLRGGNQEEKLSKKLETVGADFYENFYHSQISSNKTEEEVKEFLERFKEIGIKVDIDNLSRFDDKKYADLDKEFINKKDNILCDVRNTRAVYILRNPMVQRTSL